jgi:hypothetical protein
MYVPSNARLRSGIYRSSIELKHMRASFRTLMYLFRPSLLHQILETMSCRHFSWAVDAGIVNYVSGLNLRNVEEWCDLHRFVLSD